MPRVLLILVFISLSGRLPTPVVAEDAPAVASERPELSFERDIHPLLKTYCWKCHGGEGYAAGLDFRSLPLILRGGNAGRVLEPGSAEQSKLYQKLSSKEMPPGDALKPTEAHVATIKAWIDAGAPGAYQGGPLTDEDEPPLTDDDRQWWAFRPPVRSPVPPAADPRVRTPIDAFIVAKLAERGLALAAEADRGALVRRAYFDLIGLPPGPAELEQFLTDEAEDAWERLIDRLLDSPHFGERWGRHWLDAAGYVDVVGTDNDAGIIELRENIWDYRDYVVRSFNADKPYDRFLLEQLAGDELADWRNAAEFSPRIRELLVATGFLRMAADVTYAPELNTADIRHQVLYDTLQIVGSSLLGLTVHCAQCHSHKFDPLSHADYYRLMAVFTPAYDVQNWKHSKERRLADVPPAEQQAIDRHNAELDKQLADLTKQLADLRAPFRQQLFEGKLAALPESIRQDTRTAVETPAEKRSEIQMYLAEKLGPLVNVPPAEIAAALDETARAAVAERERQSAELQGTRRSYGRIQALWEFGEPPPNYLYRRGGYETPGAAVDPGVPAVLCGTEGFRIADFGLRIDDPVSVSAVGRQAPPNPQSAAPTASSGRRTQFARWLTQPRHPLTSRVLVNRVWQQLFGRGIVATPDNFGRSGAAPTHPELLDWLAVDFVDSGWRLKPLLRKILMSSVYRQSSVNSAALSVSADESRTETLAPPTPTLPPPGGEGDLPRMSAHPQSAIPHPQSANPQSIDPENHLLWRMPLRRLESEIIRDALLAVSGVLDARIGGPPTPVKPLPDGMVIVETENLPPGTTPFRRSLYLVSRRNYQPTELSVFDQPLVATNCTRRTSAAVALQSLTMLNGRFAAEQAERFAARVAGDAGDEDVLRIELAFRLSLSRPPTAEELELSRALLATQRARAAAQPHTTAAQANAQALTHLCHMLLNTNEFLYVP